MSPRLVSALGRPWLAALRYHSTALTSSRGRPSSPWAYLTPSWFCAAGSPRLAAAKVPASGPARAAASAGLIVGVTTLGVGCGFAGGGLATTGTSGACGTSGGGVDERKNRTPTTAIATSAAMPPP